MKKRYWKKYQNQLFQDFIKKNEYVLIFKEPNIKIKTKQALEVQLKNEGCFIFKCSTKQIDLFQGSLMIVSIQDEDQIELVNKLMDKKNLLALKIGNKVYDKSFLSKNWKNAKTELLNVLSPKSFILNLNKPVKELILIIDN